MRGGTGTCRYLRLRDRQKLPGVSEDIFYVMEQTSLVRADTEVSSIDGSPKVGAKGWFTCRLSQYGDQQTGGKLACRHVTNWAKVFAQSMQVCVKNK